MPRPTPFRALLIDFDGVIRRWTASEADLETGYGLPAGAIRSVAFAPALLQPAITGQVSDESWRTGVAQQLAAAHPQGRAYEAVRAWSAVCGEVDQAVLRIVRRARRSAKVVLVTNATSRLSADLEQLNLTAEFDAVINSSRVGMAKPSRGLFCAALHQAGVAASESVFVDDSLVNVRAAEDLGMRSHLFEGAVGLRAFLRA
jgi:HAD superfamily hydrolase (TIGR01509 family)